MKKKIFLSIFAILTLAVGVFAFAYTASDKGSRTSMSTSCCDGDSCPMKKKGASGTETASCCDGGSCCKGDSCPMKKMNASATETASCCDSCSCCTGDSCPMKKKDASQTSVTSDTAQPVPATETKSNGSSCCKHKMEMKDTPAV